MIRRKIMKKKEKKKAWKACGYMEGLSFQACYHLLPAVSISSSYKACLSIPCINKLGLTIFWVSVSVAKQLHCFIYTLVKYGQWF